MNTFFYIQFFTNVYAMVRIVAKEEFAIKNFSSNRPLSEAEEDAVLNVLKKVKDYKEPIKTEFGMAYLMQIPDNPNPIQTVFDVEKYNALFIMGSEFVNGVISMQDMVPYCNYAGCNVWVIGNLYTKTKEKDGEKKEFTNIKLRAWFIASDKPDDVPPTPDAQAETEVIETAKSNRKRAT